MGYPEIDFRLSTNINGVPSHFRTWAEPPVAIAFGKRDQNNNADHSNENGKLPPPTRWGLRMTANHLSSPKMPGGILSTAGAHLTRPFTSLIG